MMDDKWTRIERWVAALLTALGAALSFYYIYKYFPIPAATEEVWWIIIKLATAVLLSFGAAAILRFALSPLLGNIPSNQGPAADPDIALRSRIAPIILGIGSSAILILALVLIIAFSILGAGGSNPYKLETVLPGIFSSVLPVFAAWVSTVLTFYFTNESYRQAAENAREAAGTGAVQTRATDRMIPYEKIAKIVSTRVDARSSVKMLDVFKLFNDQITRVIIFDGESKQPIFIIRKKSPPMPPNIETNPDATIDDYLKVDNNANDATLFGYVARSATLEAARAVMRNAKCVDVFVTETGQKTEPVIGWLTDDIMKP